MKLLQSNVLGRNKLNCFEAMQVLKGLAQILIWESEIATGGTWGFGMKGEPNFRGDYEPMNPNVIYIYIYIYNTYIHLRL